MQQHLLAGEPDSALELLDSERTPRLDYLRAVALERRALGSVNGAPSEMDYFRGTPLGLAAALRPSTEAFVQLLEDESAEFAAEAHPESELALPPAISWCTPADERYPEAAVQLARHTSLMRWGPLNLRSGLVAVPGSRARLREYVLARLTTQAQHLDPNARQALLRRLESCGVAHAARLLELTFTQSRSQDYWQGLASASSEEDWLFVAAAIGSLATGAPANTIAPTYNRLVGRFPLLAREYAGWADMRRVNYDASALRKPTPSGPLTVRLLEDGGPFLEGVAFAVVREAGAQPEVLLQGESGADGSFVVPRALLSQACTVRVRGHRVGQLDASDHLLKQLRVPSLIGSPAPDCAMSSLLDGRRLRLSELRGQIVYVDFWATWCAPCQAPLAELDQLAERRQRSWRGRASLLAVSIDADRARLEAHVEQRGWNHVRQLWAGPDLPAVQGPFEVTGVPTAFLIDAEGTIVWTGHPADIEVEREIEALLEARAENG